MKKKNNTVDFAKLSETLMNAQLPELYYVQDSRTYVGNSVLWWKSNGEGYTTNLAEAMKVDKDWVGRDTDILWPCKEIDKRVTLQFDMQRFREIKRECS